VRATAQSSVSAAFNFHAAAELFPCRGRKGKTPVSYRRFADHYPADPLDRLAPGGSGLLTIRPDRSPRPWHVRVAPEARLTACAAPS